MKNLMSAFIDSYEDLTLLLEKKGKYKGKTFYLYNGNGQLLEELKISYQAIEKNFIKFGLKYTTNLDLTKDYFVVDDMNMTYPIYSGSIIRNAEFEARYYYDGPLGVSYTKEKTIFRLWTPVAKSVRVEICKDCKTITKDLSYYGKGLWSLELEGDYECATYVYLVKIFNKYSKIVDPYGISSTANGTANYVVDTNKFYKMKYPKPYFSGYYSDAVVYEVSIRDLTVSLKNDNKGTFLGAIESNGEYKEKIGLEYIASLGVTHLQLMPVYDFGGVDDIKKDESYNWGYNPEQYFVPNGWYSKNPNDPYSRINEMLMLIDEAHRLGMRVVMDVVYNHVYKVEEFPFDFMVPGYFYRVDFYGNQTSVSGCGNDIATEKRMCSRFVIDNLKYWASVFNISGFRFDLMGLLDIETVNKAYEDLHKIDDKMMVYGEGWNMPNTIPDAYRPHAFNHFKMPNYAFFNDKYRDVIKGSQWNTNYGYVFGGDSNNAEIFSLLSGSCLKHYKFDNPNQTINYVECHDNYTLYDFAKERLRMKEENIIDGARLALQVIAISQGVPFIHAGQEFYRTRKGVENAYNASDAINMLDFDRRDKYLDDINGLKDLLKIRKEYPEFRLTNAFDIEKKMHYIEALSNKNRLCYVLEGKNYLLTVCVNTKKDESVLALKNSTMIFDGRKKCSIKQDSYVIREIGVTIFKEDR